MIDPFDKLLLLYMACVAFVPYVVFKGALDDVEAAEEAYECKRLRWELGKWTLTKLLLKMALSYLKRANDADLAAMPPRNELPS